MMRLYTCPFYHIPGYGPPGVNSTLCPLFLLSHRCAEAYCLEKILLLFVKPPTELETPHTLFG